MLVLVLYNNYKTFTMGDDAEYYIEQQQEEADFYQQMEYAQEAEKTKSLYCWTDQNKDSLLWSWEPLSRVENVFFSLHHSKQLGSEYFLSDGVESDLLDSVQSPNLKSINGLKFNIVTDKTQAEYEIIVLSQQDVTQLEIEVINQKNTASSLKEIMLSEMLHEMALFIKKNKSENLFIFIREL